MAKSAKSQKRAQSFFINLVLIIICVAWMVPILGILITSFRHSEDIFKSGWWTVFPHRVEMQVARIKLNPDVDLDDIITIDATTATIEGRNAAGEAVEYSGSPIEGVSATFEEYREGIKLDDGRSLVWSGNRRSRELRVFDRQWIGFSTNLTLKNYKDVITGKNITYKDAEGRTITRTGNNLGGAFLNSLAVAIPGTIIPILIAAFAAFGFAWLEFPGRNILFTIIVALLVVPLQIALVPILKDYVNMGLNGTFLGIWLAHSGFGLPLATYLLFNYISTIPRELLESAFIDGASNFTIFIRLIFPLSVPALASFAIFQFLWLWNDYLVALIFLGERNKTVTIAVAQMVGEKGQDWHLMTSAAFVSMILPLAVFLALQRYFVRGMMAGSVKG
ncbi:MAG: carbohydrate ABC transporter permease [Brevefilum fermentans]|jgi:alpha-glucoside transport system permease protein|uniref:Alpha-glucoside transport system permease protein AglG n=1 Tax=Candidatus Brevifilum fermentans TaxID=1986204 RepID=A0A1Y6K6H5_9CHLR|nr:carbohydrate ABC transporter permease [Brevefilum fermentans]MDI9566777.1 carbohydrate ABC transporter permease [Chloroflexota bacterium]SMX54498.1 Alpha-glucoside transport system permease protein AglG [Brevefilum fermentans]